MLDIIVLVILLMFALVGSRKGLINTVLTFLSSLGALILSFILYPAVNMLLKITPLYTYINERVSQKIASINFGTGIQSQGNAITEKLTWLPEFISESLIKNNNTEVYKVLGAHNVMDYVSISITNIIIAMLALLVTWFILKFVLVGSLQMVGTLVAKLPVISSFNKLGGFCIGLAKGLLTFWIVVLIVPCIITNPDYQGLETYIQGSILFKWLYENNLILIIFKQLF